MANAFAFKTYYNPHVGPSTNSCWGVVSVTANEMPQQAQDTMISLICDVSGSMQGAKFNGVVETVEMLLQTAPDGLYFNVVVFDNKSHEVLPATRLHTGLNRDSLVASFRKTMKSLSVFGGTSMSAGIRQALKSQANIHQSMTRYGIFLTDGQNTEPEAHLAAAVREAANTQMHLCAY